MADVFLRYLLDLTTTDSTNVFTVPVANVAATPPTPVSTYVLKNITIHNDSGSPVIVTLTHNDGTSDFEIGNVTVSANSTNTNSNVFVFEGGDIFKVQANAANRALVSVSLLNIKQQL